MKRIVLTGGGTAGHVTPNLALIPRLLADGWDVHYIGEADGVEKRLLSLSWRGYAMRWKVFYRRPGVDSSWTLAGSTARPAYVVRNLEIGYVYRLAVTATSNPMDGKAIDVDFQLGSSSGVVLDVVVGSEPVMVGDQTVQAII